MSPYRVNKALLAAFFCFCCAAPSWSQDGIAVVELAEADPFAVGALSPSERPAPADLWANSDAEGVSALLGAVPQAHGASLAGSRLAARAVLSQSDAPAGLVNRREMLLARLNAAYALGRVEAVNAIVTGSIGAILDPDLARFGALSRFAMGQAEAACTLGDGLATGREEAFWVRVRAACFALRGEHQAASLTFDLAAEAGAEGADAEFARWLARLADGEGAVPPAPRDAVEFALARMAGVPLTPDLADEVSLAQAAGLALSADVAPGLRLRAARRAARAGAISPSDYAEALAAAGGPADRPALEHLNAAFAAEGLQQAALLRQAIAGAPNSALAAEALAAALDSSQDGRDFILAAEMYAADIAALPRDAVGAAYAPVFAEAAAVVGDVAGARAWMATRRTQTAPAGPMTLTDVAPDAPEIAPALEPTLESALGLLIAAADPQADGAALAESARNRMAASRADAPEARQGAAREALILFALGAANGPDMRRFAYEAVADGALLTGEADGALYAMEAAVDARARGEAALRAAIALGLSQEGHSLASARAARALWRAGFDAEARAVAVEAILVARRG